jgi:hypothetical protein
VATKIDAAGEGRETLRAHCAEQGSPYFEISAVTHEGVPELLRAVGARIEAQASSVQAAT